MGVAVIPVGELSEELVARWAEIHQCNPDLCSPFFSPDFTQAVSRVRKDVFVAVINDGEAFFPFQRSVFGFGRPVGGPLSDYHGLIAPAGYRCDALALMQACKLRSWDFDHVPAHQAAFAPWRLSEAEALVLDLEEGCRPGSGKFHSNCNSKWRRLEADFGPVEVELNTSDRFVLDLCLHWKSGQYRRTSECDLFSRPWARQLAEVIASQQGAELAGTVSVLRAGGRPIAAHFGMRSHTVWHHWFPAHDPQFNSYSPGMLLLRAMIVEAPKLGIKTIDFGAGDYEYKLRLANRKMPLLKGAVVTASPVRVLRDSKANLLWSIRKIPLPQTLSTQFEKLVQYVREKIQFACYGMTFLWL